MQCPIRTPYFDSLVHVHGVSDMHMLSHLGYIHRSMLKIAQVVALVGLEPRFSLHGNLHGISA